MRNTDELFCDKVLTSGFEVKIENEFLAVIFYLNVLLIFFGVVRVVLQNTSIREMFYNACLSSCSIICKPSSSLRFPLDCLTSDTLDSKVSFLLAGKHVLDRINNDNASFCHAITGILHGTRHRTTKKNSKEKKGKYAGVVPFSNKVESEVSRKTVL